MTELRQDLGDEPKTVNTADVAGAWILDTWEDWRSGNAASTASQGMIVYDSGGWMSAFLERLDGRQHEAARLASDQSTALCYAGSWDLQGDLIRHHIRFSNMVGWPGTTLERQIIARSGRRISLRARVQLPTGSGYFILHWRRPTDRDSRADTVMP